MGSYMYNLKKCIERYYDKVAINFVLVKSHTAPPDGYIGISFFVVPCKPLPPHLHYAEWYYAEGRSGLQVQRRR